MLRVDPKRFLFLNQRLNRKLRSTNLLISEIVFYRLLVFLRHPVSLRLGTGQFYYHSVKLRTLPSIFLFLFCFFSCFYYYHLYLSMLY